VLTRLLLISGRYRRVVLTVGVTAAAVYLVAHMRSSTFRDQEPAIFAVAVAFFMLALAASAVPRPRTLLVRPQVPAFITWPRAGDVYASLGQLALSTALASIYLRDSAEGHPSVDLRLAMILPVITLIGVAATWRSTGIELRPDGLRDVGVLGVLVVPWDALPVVALPRPADRPTALSVRYAHPALVRRRGLVGSKRLNVSNIDPVLAAKIIQYYTTRPEHRAAIGTPAEYERLLTEIHDSPPHRPDGDS
jgi:hypothetical protein